MKGKRRKGCIFCQARKPKARDDYVVFESKYSISLLNIFPYNNGHMLIAPKKHIREISQLKTPEVIDLIGALNRTKKILDKVLKPDGYNIGINISMSAGAGIPGHLHIHIVPRWEGDTNFMPVLSDTKIISQSLAELYRKLKYAESKTN